VQEEEHRPAAHPRYGLSKTYLVKVRGRVEGEMLDKVRRGVHLAEGRTGGARLRVVKRTTHFTVLEVTIAEGKNREVRRVFAQVGAKVQSLKRIRIGHLADRRLKPGQWRPLLRAEVAALLAEAGVQPEVEPVEDLPAAPARPRPAGRGGGRKPKTRAVPRPQGQRFGPRAAQRWSERQGDAGRPRPDSTRRGSKKR